MKLAIFGTGYVGLVTGACLANAGHKVTCVDIDEKKINLLKSEGCPIVEKDLPERIQQGNKSGNLCFTIDARTAIEENDVIFIAVGTPTKDRSEEADLSAVFAVVGTICDYANKSKIVVQKSTVPVGTGDEVEGILNSILEGGESFGHTVVSNPEFLKEGKAIQDFEFPDRVIIGTDNGKVEKVMGQIYEPFMRTQNRMIFMSRSSAELTKVLANTLLAMRISSMNVITELAEKFGADVAEIRAGVGSDSRIGSAFLFPGGATFGGSCFPKDVRALIAVMESFGLNANLFREVMSVNCDQRMRFIRKIFEYFDNSMVGKKIAVWGLAFKPETDDVREAASLDIVRGVIGKGGEAVLYDAYAQESFHKAFGGNASVSYCQNKYQALEKVDALIILTDAMEFRSLDFEKLRSGMKKMVIFDGKNLHEPELMANNRVNYFCMGRPYILPKNR
ncbi:MAG: UDP-glucose/GDP-mannose dehydrogenase family protein [Candidatus Moranbacteria bacterium]|nr:UDP-glucose/GDP-mannose dehydrogenase family protein [Candidatus Moranbacteria bacterium]